MAPGYYFFFLLLICAGFPVCNASAATFSNQHPAVVRVAVAERDGAAYGSGSLVAVDDTAGLILTNWHVVRDAAGPIVVYFPDGFHSGAYLLRTDRDWDLAALAIRRPPNAQPIPISRTSPQPGDTLTIIGYGSGSYLVQTGRCTQYVSPGGNLPFEMVELSAGARNGDSGGPILNSRGELAGVLFGSAFGRTTGSYCGRLHGFVNLVAGDFRRISNQAMLADRTRQSQTPVAAISTSTEVAGASSVWQPAVASRVVENAPSEAVASAPLTPLPTRSPLPAPPSAVAASAAASAGSPACSVPGSVVAAAAPPPVPIPLGDQAKTVLALIGAIAVLYHALRMLGAAVG